MQKTFSHLAYLLTEHDCVIIPGFGGFVVHRNNAQCNQEKGFFTPPSYTVGFNSQLIHNDGLLVNSLMQDENLEYKTALSKTGQIAEEIKNQLSTLGEISFPEIGKLTISENGKFNFIPFEDIVVNSPMYGFSNFYMPLLKEQEIEKTTTTINHIPSRNDDDVVVMTVNKRFLKVIASGAAIILAILMFSTPIDNIKVPDQYASIINSESIQIFEKQIHKSTNKPTQEEVSEEIIIPTIEMTPGAIETPIESVKEIIIEKNIPERSYYIIVCSSPVKGNAANYLPTIRSKITPQADILEKDNLFRIYVAKFSEKSEAESYLANFRIQNPQHKDAWLLAVQ